jgi:hypothetical protein
MEIEQNKLIAKFMDIPVSEFHWKDWVSLIIGNEDDAMDYANLTYYTPNSNWNQLFPVLEKIEALGYKWEIGMGHYQESRLHYCTMTRVGTIEAISPMDAVYNVIIEFIKWYNGKQV